MTASLRNSRAASASSSRLPRALAVGRARAARQALVRFDAKVRKNCAAGCVACMTNCHVTSVFVTHDRDEAVEVSDRIVHDQPGQVRHKSAGAPDGCVPQSCVVFRLQLPRFSQPLPSCRQFRRGLRARTRPPLSLISALPVTLALPRV